MTTLSLKPAEPIVITQYEVLLGDIKEAQLNAIESFEYETKDGDKQARSYIYKLRQLRAKIEAQRKTAKEYALNYGRAVDSQAKGLTEKVDKLIAPHQAALDAIARAEAERIESHERRLQAAAALGRVEYGADAATIRGQLDAVNSLSVEGLDEFTDRVRAALAKSRKDLTAALAAREKADADAEELARLRREAEERRQKDAEADAARAQAEVEAAKAAATAERVTEQVTEPGSRYRMDPLPIGDASPAPKFWNPGEKPRPASAFVAPVPPRTAAELQSCPPSSWVVLLAWALAGKDRTQVAVEIIKGSLHPAVIFDPSKMP